MSLSEDVTYMVSCTERPWTVKAGVLGILISKVVYSALRGQSLQCAYIALLDNAFDVPVASPYLLSLLRWPTTVFISANFLAEKRQ